MDGRARAQPPPPASPRLSAPAWLLGCSTPGRGSRLPRTCFPSLLFLFFLFPALIWVPVPTRAQLCSPGGKDCGRLCQSLFLQVRGPRGRGSPSSDPATGTPGDYLSLFRGGNEAPSERDSGAAETPVLVLARDTPTMFLISPSSPAA